MPYLDKTGPKGKGPKTGRGLGLCKAPKGTKKNMKTGTKWGAGVGGAMGVLGSSSLGEMAMGGATGMAGGAVAGAAMGGTYSFLKKPLKDMWNMADENKVLPKKKPKM